MIQREQEESKFAMEKGGHGFVHVSEEPILIPFLVTMQHHFLMPKPPAGLYRHPDSVFHHHWLSPVSQEFCHKVKPHTFPSFSLTHHRF